jgi:hypothetical protein
MRKWPVESVVALKRGPVESRDATCTTAPTSGTRATESKTIPRMTCLGPRAGFCAVNEAARRAAMPGRDRHVIAEYCLEIQRIESLPIKSRSVSPVTISYVSVPSE